MFVLELQAAKIIDRLTGLLCIVYHKLAISKWSGCQKWVSFGFLGI